MSFTLTIFLFAAGYNDCKKICTVIEVAILRKS